MPHVDAPVAQTELHLCREFEQTQEVGHGGSLFSYSVRQFLLCKRILVDKFAESKRDFDGVQVLSLNIFDEGHFSELEVGGSAHIGGHALQAGFYGGSVAHPR